MNGQTPKARSTFGLVPAGVKPVPRGTSDLRPGIARHFEGWEAGTVIVGMAVFALLFAAPRRVEPDELPAPRTDPARLGSLDRLEGERAKAAHRDGLPFEVRALGEQLRRLGRSLAAGDSLGAARVQGGLAHAVEAALAHGDDAVLRLRAVQTRLFLLELARWEATGESTVDLDELGGAFLDQARKSGWIRRGKLVLSFAERAALFRARWTQLTGLAHAPTFAPTLEEQRAYYALLLRHPEGASPRAADRSRLDYVEALAKIDPDYPAAVARGVLLFRLGDYRQSEAAFRARAESHPDGEWSLRVRNYLAEAAARAAATHPE